MPTRGSIVRLCGTLAVVLGLAPTFAAPSSAATVKHKVIVSTFDIHWTCPGRNPVEHATTTVHRTEVWVGGVRVRAIEHTLWRGHIENRDTGALMRDYG